MQLRKLNPSDAEVFRQFRINALRESPESFAQSHSEYGNTTIEQVAHRIEKAAPGFILGSFSAESTLIGVVGLSYNSGERWQHRMHLWGTYVEPKFRSSGIGKALMLETIRIATDISGVEIIELAVITSNTSAYNLYKSIGFKPWGTEPKALKIGTRYFDEVHMMLDIKAT